MAAYYNENDPFAAAWLKNLISAGLIAAGDVDERSIVDVQPGDLTGYAQCHFFAGIGGWSVALRLAGWPDDRSVWTGSCPCQPFSAAGAGKAADDERHLWPAWLPLIAERRPAIVFGEQVEASVGWGWIDAVFTDLESEGYACGATVLPACSVGAPHIRQRLWFVADATGRDQRRHGGEPRSAAGAREGEARSAHGDSVGGAGPLGSLADADGRNASTEGLQRSGQHGQRTQDRGAGLANADSSRRRTRRSGEASVGRGAPRIELAGLRDVGNVANPASRGLRKLGDASRSRSGRHTDGCFWAGAEFIACTDGKARPVRPGSFPLAHGIQRRTSKLRAFGNAIVPQVAAEFIGAYLDA